MNFGHWSPTLLTTSVKPSFPQHLAETFTLFWIFSSLYLKHSPLKRSSTFSFCSLFGGMFCVIMKGFYLVRFFRRGASHDWLALAWNICGTSVSQCIYTPWNEKWKCQRQTRHQHWVQECKQDVRRETTAEFREALRLLICFCMFLRVWLQWGWALVCDNDASQDPSRQNTKHVTMVFKAAITFIHV